MLWLSRCLSPLLQLQQQLLLLLQAPQQQQRWWKRWELLQQLLLPPLLPIEGAPSDLPLLHGGVIRLDASILKLQLRCTDSSDGAADSLSPRRLVRGLGFRV